MFLPSTQSRYACHRMWTPETMSLAEKLRLAVVKTIRYKVAQQAGCQTPLWVKYHQQQKPLEVLLEKATEELGVLPCEINVTRTSVSTAIIHTDMVRALQI